MLISRNCSRQGAPSESDEAVVTCGESLESRSNAVLRDLHNLQSVTTRKSPLTARMLVGGNFARQGAPSESDEAVVTYGESLESRSNAVLGIYTIDKLCHRTGVGRWKFCKTRRTERK